MARAGESAVPADPSTAPESGSGIVIPGRDENGARGAVVLPDEVVARMLRFVLEGEREGDDAHTRWSVGGRFRVPAPDAARRLSLERRRRKADGASDDETAAPRLTRNRGRLRLVSKQWRRVLDRTCVEIEVRQAVIFGDEALAGLATALRDADAREDAREDSVARRQSSREDPDATLASRGRDVGAGSCSPPRRLVLEGSHLCDGAFRLTTRGISAFAAALPSLVALHVERTGMDVAEVLRVAAACPNLAELAVDGGAREGGVVLVGAPHASTRAAPFESALLHAMPCASAYAAMDALARLFRDGAGRLRSVALRRAPGVFADVFESRPFDARTGSISASANGPRSPEGAERVCAALETCDSLRHLTLEEVGVSDAIGARVARSLPARLETFSVDGDDVGRRTGATIAVGLAGLADAPASFPALSLVQIPRRAAFGAVAAVALDRALARRRSDARPTARALFVRVAPNADPAADRDARARVAFSTRVLRRWLVTREDKCRAFEARGGGDRRRDEADVRCLSSEARLEPSRAGRAGARAAAATRTARETLRYLAAWEDWEASESLRGDDGDGDGPSPRLVWATTCVGAPYRSLERARDWLKRRPRDDSLAATAARVAARERFSRLAGALQREPDASLASERASRASTLDAKAFDAVARAVARDARTVADDAAREDGRLEDEAAAETVQTRRGSARARDAPSEDSALRRALACVALPAALARAAAEEDAASGRDAKGASPAPSLPPVVLDLVHDETCALLIAEDLVRVDAERAERRPFSTRARPPLVDEATFRGGSAWCALEATARALAPAAEGEAKDRAVSVRENAAGFLAPDALPRWIDAGVAGSPEDAALAADAAASALLRLVGHESVSLGARGLRALAKILGKAAALVPGDAFASEGETRPPDEASRSNASWRRLHNAVRAVFAAREFAPLLSGNVERGQTRRDADDDARALASSPALRAGFEPSAPPYVVSWSQWLHAVGAPPPLASAAAAAAAEALRAKSEAYERMEAEAASLRARMSRLASDLRRVALDVRTSRGFHREPARELLLRAHAAVGWRAVPRESGAVVASGASPRRGYRQTSLFEAFGKKDDADAGSDGVGASSARPPRRADAAFAAPRDAVHRVPREGWREEALEALDALFAHAARAAPFVPDADVGTVGGPDPGWSLVNDAGDATRAFAREWERRACAAMLAWYVETRANGPSSETRTPVDDVLRVLGAANASDARASSDGRERFPVDAMSRLRREGGGRGPPATGLGGLGGLGGLEGLGSIVDGDGDTIVVELDARLRWNLMLDA